MSSEQMEALKTVAGQVAENVRDHFPDGFTINHRVVETSGGKVVLQVQTPGHGPQLLASINANKVALPESATSDGERGGESVEAVSVEIIASLVSRMTEVSDSEAIKSRPAS